MRPFFRSSLTGHETSMRRWNSTRASAPSRRRSAARRSKQLLMQARFLHPLAPSWPATPQRAWCSGSGNADADLMFRRRGARLRARMSRGCPSWGRAGKLLSQLLEEIGLLRDDVFIVNHPQVAGPRANRDPASRAENRQLPRVPGSARVELDRTLRDLQASANFLHEASSAATRPAFTRPARASQR